MGGRTSAGAARASRTVPCRLAQRRKSVYAMWGWSWQIEEKYCNRVLLENGLCICLYELLDLGDGLIYQSDASVHVRAEFTYSAYARARAHTARCALVRASHLSQKSPSGPHALPAYYGRDSPRGAGARENSCSGSARQAAASTCIHHIVHMHVCVAEAVLQSTFTDMGMCEEQHIWK